MASCIFFCCSVLSCQAEPPSTPFREKAPSDLRFGGSASASPRKGSPTAMAPLLARRDSLRLRTGCEPERWLTWEPTSGLALIWTCSDDSYERCEPLTRPSDETRLATRTPLLPAGAVMRRAGVLSDLWRLPPMAVR